MEVVIFTKKPTEKNPYILAVAMMSPDSWGSFLRTFKHKGIFTEPIARRPMVDFERDNMTRIHRLTWFKYKTWEALIKNEWEITQDVNWCKQLIELSEVKQFSDKFPKDLLKLIQEESHMTYEELLSKKIIIAEKHGYNVPREAFHPSMRPDQVDIAQWCLSLGAALVAPDAGCGKTRVGIEVMRILQGMLGGKCLIATELGAADTFIDKDPAVGEGVCLGLNLEYVTNQSEAFASESDIVVTNYERIRDGNFDFGAFTAVWLDEGNYVKNMASLTTNELKDQLAKVKFKYIATATPSPNEDLELVNYAHALGICDRGQILTRFFQRNSTKAGDLTLHPQHVADFWLWVSSWCIAITDPGDLGYFYPDLQLPDLCLNWVEVPINKSIDAGAEKNGQAKMFVDSRSGLGESAKIKRESIDVRVAKAMEIMAENPGDHFLLWHHLEAERKAPNEANKGNSGYADIYGSMKDTVRENRVVAFTKGELQVLATKPSLNGVGCNFQKYCHKSIFVGIDDSFNDLYQALKRTWRFYNPSETVYAWLLYTPEEYDIVQNLRRKWEEHNEMRARLRAIIKEFGLSQTAQIEERKRTFILERKEWQGEGYHLVNNDAVIEWKTLQDNRFDFMNSSYPFGNHYEYTNFYNDFGHNRSNEDFRRQLDFLLPELFRTLKPGRIHTVHLKNRIHYGSVTGDGFSVFHRFTHMVCDAMEAHGFKTMGFHYIPTDVVLENNQTYRLTYGEMQKDSTKMGSGIPEEIWIFRKPPTTTVNAYADEPVKHNHLRCPFCHHEEVEKEFKRPKSALLDCPSCKQFITVEEIIRPEMDYSLAHWQVDADAFWKSSGDRLLTPAQIKKLDLSKISKWWKEFNSAVVYDYDEHVKLLQALDDAGKLSRTFTTLPLRSNTPYIWNDVNRMHGLNLEQSRRKQQNHICPQPYDEVDRVIELYSNPGDEVGDPFGGLGTTGVRALKKKRRAFMTELNPVYSVANAHYLKEAELKNNIPTLFDMITEQMETA